jgi:nucleotide-binding universal stress UspA family protein
MGLFLCADLPRGTSSRIALAPGWDDEAIVEKRKGSHHRFSTAMRPLRAGAILMLRFQSILVPIDFSEPSREARAHAEALAAETGARLIFLHVVEPSQVVEQSLFFGQTGFTIPSTEEDLSRRINLLERLHAYRIPDSEFPVEYRLREGETTEEILRVADETGCDLIVLGTHGRTGMDRLWRGSVAESVLRRAHCPVLIVKESTHAFPVEDSPQETVEDSLQETGVV